MILSTVFMGAWLVLMSRITGDDWRLAAYSRVLDNLSKIEALSEKAKIRETTHSSYRRLADLWKRVMPGDGSLKKADKLKQDNIRLQQGHLRTVHVFEMPGYVLQRKFEIIGKGGIHKNIMTYCYELYGKKYAAYKTKQLLARLLSYPIIGIAVTFMLGALLIGIGSDTAGAAILAIGGILVLVIVYAMYDELRDRVKKRRAEISRQFPNVASKLALLVTSGMVMDRAWKETAYSAELELYKQMRKTTDELDNLVSPEVAFGNFVNRCNTKETSKLASAIVQNISKGNAEVGRLLKDMAREAWQERRHLAKRDAEKANSKLMIPTMLLLLAILVMLMVPVAMNFSGL